MNKNTDNSFFIPEGVKKCKDALLKTRLQTLIKASEQTEPDFYNSLGFTKQYWYMISWGLETPSQDVMFRISKALNVDSRLIFPFEVRK